MRPALSGWFAALALLGGARDGSPLAIDDAGDMRLGLRTYAAVRFGTNHMDGEENPLTFPSSGVGHLRQSRYFVQLDLDRDLTRSVRGRGLARLLAGWLDPDLLRYSVSYRGEWEGL